ncbi:hypothetical protein C8T65DRAFT_745096 [Cerioporus squamosus]|nr:hypothetical protein C8T65DRAFT_745096 [Cerioporus squamosus]
MQHCAWGGSPNAAFFETEFFPRHVSKLAALYLWLDYPTPVPLPLSPFGTNLTLLEIDAVHTCASTVEYKGIASLEKLQTLILRYTGPDISYVPHALSLIRSMDLRSLAITHRVEDQTVDAMVRHLEAFSPRLQVLLVRSAFWSLRLCAWEILGKELPDDAGQEKWKKAVTPFLQVMADRNILSLRVADCPRSP